MTPSARTLLVLPLSERRCVVPKAALVKECRYAKNSAAWLIPVLGRGQTAALGRLAVTSELDMAHRSVTNRAKKKRQVGISGDVRHATWKAVSTTETSTSFYTSTRGNIPEDSRLHTRPGYNTKPQGKLKLFIRRRNFAPVFITTVFLTHGIVLITLCSGAQFTQEPHVDYMITYLPDS